MPKSMTFKDKIKTRSGKCFDDEIIYVTTRDGIGRPSFVHGRRIVMNRMITEHNIQFGERIRQSADLYKRLPQLFVNDLKRYASGYNTAYRENDKPVSGYNIFIGVLGRQSTQIFSLMSLSETFGNTLDEWIENGILEPINTVVPFNATITG